MEKECRAAAEANAAKKLEKQAKKGKQVILDVLVEKLLVTELWRQQQTGDMLDFCESELATMERQNSIDLDALTTEFESVYSGKECSKSLYSVSPVIVMDFKIHYNQYLADGRNLLLDVDPPFKLSE